MLGRVGSSVGRLGIISANRGPNFSYTGTNAAFQSALTEAAYTGLVAGFSAPAYPQYWLRGVSYPSFLSVPGATYTRTGSRAGLDAAVIYPANVPRIAAVNGLRVHGAGTNLIRASEAFDDAVWLKNVSTVTANTAVSPNGTMTADKIVVNSGSALGLATGAGPRQQPAKSAQAITYTQSVYAKAAEFNSVMLILSNLAVTSLARCTFNLSDGTAGAVVISGFSSATASIVSIGDGWFRVSLTATSDTDTTIRASYLPMDTVATTGNGTSGLLLWGAQLEQSSFATDYIPNPNTGASSSAGADDAVLGTAAGVTLGADHAILIEGIVPDLIAGAFPDFIGWSASSSSVGIFVNASGSNLGVAAGGGTINLTGGPTFTKGQVVRALFRVSGGNTGRLFVNGVAAFANTAFTPSTGLTSLFLGQTPAKTSLLSSSLNIAAVLLRAPSDAECLAMTAL